MHQRMIKGESPEATQAVADELNAMAGFSDGEVARARAAASHIDQALADPEAAMAEIMADD
jgi:hypothetical protein